MKRKLKLLLAALSPAIAACGLIGNDPSQFALETTSSVEINAASQRIVIPFKCDKAWESSLASGKWASIAMEGISQDNISGSVTIAVNLNTGDDVRKDTLIVTSGRKKLQAEIVQKGLGSYLSTTLVSLDDAGATLEVNAVNPWTIDTEEGGSVAAVPSSGEAGRTKVTFSLTDERAQYDDLQETLLFTSGNDEIGLRVVKSHQDAILVDGDALSVSFLGETLTIRTEYNVEYKVESSASWLKPLSSKALKEGEVTLLCYPNNFPDERTATVVIRSVDDEGLFRSITVTQQGKDPLLTETVPGIYYTSSENFLYDNNKHQIARNWSSGMVSFRIMDIGAESVTVISGYPDNSVPGDGITLVVTTTEGESVTYDTVLLNVSDETAWLRGKDGTGFIIKI